MNTQIIFVIIQREMGYQLQGQLRIDRNDFTFFFMVFGDRVYIPGWFPTWGNSVSGLRGMPTRSGLFNFETGFHYEAQGGLNL